MRDGQITGNSLEPFLLRHVGNSMYQLQLIAESIVITKGIGQSVAKILNYKL